MKYLSIFRFLLVCLVGIIPITLFIYFIPPIGLAANTHATVTIQGSLFNPDPLNIPIGGSVTWINRDSVMHNAVGDGKSPEDTWDSKPLQLGQSYTKTFNTAGSYTYSCTFHPNMTGTIIVGNPGMTVTPTPITSITPIPSVTIFQNGMLYITVGLHDIGTVGDNPNITSKGNMHPMHTVRPVTITLVNTATNQSSNITGTITYDPVSGLFNGMIDEKNISSGNYQIFVKSDGYLRKQVPGVQTISSQQMTVIPKVLLVNGDINNDNQIDILDYNILLSCFGSKIATSECKKPITSLSNGADLSDDGIVDSSDYNMYIREISVQHGDNLAGNNSPTPSIVPTGISKWDKAKANYLARRVLLDPTYDDINNIANTASPNDAVNKLFAPPSQAEITNYQNGLQQLIQAKSTYKSIDTYEYTLYTYQLVHDPSRIQRKLFYLWENIFSVDAPLKNKNITYDDVKGLRQLLYDNSFGNYLQLVNNVQNNYAMAQYLDLTNSKANNPNENFARELLQLFLMGPYSPLDKQQTNPNYTDQDVNSLAYVLTGFTADPVAHTMSFSNTNHYQQQKLFLGQQFNDPINDISYIEQQRKSQISEFLANKLLHYYVTDNPQNQDIIDLSKTIQANNFEILPTIKTLLTSDMMYRDAYMQEERYKTPLELVTSYYTLLYGRSSYNIIPSSGLLTALNFQPYRPGSIFGRDGFNNNLLFYSGSVINTWIAGTNALVNNITPQNVPVVLANLVPNYQTIKTPADLFSAVSQTIYIGRDTPQVVKDTISNYLVTDNTGKTISFNLSDPKYVSSKLPGVLNLLLIQPEFLQQSGISTTNLPSLQTQGGNPSPKLVVIRLRGGIDYQGLVANVADPSYAANRKQMALSASTSAQLGNGYVLNNAANSLLPLISSKEVFFVNAVGFPNHSRAHDIASRQMETGLDPQGNGILANLVNTNKSLSIMTFSNTPPVMAKGATSLQVGGSSLLLYPGSGTANSENAIRKKNMEQMFTGRQFPQELSLYYAQALLLDKLGADNIAHGGKGTAGYTNQTQFAFLDQLLTQNTGNVFYLYGDGGYDHHIHEDNQLNTEVTSLLSNITSFYNIEKIKTKLAVVIFSEFGRTNKINGSNGTDHGEGGGMIVISNALQWPEMIGNITPSRDVSNWTTVQVDARDVWSSLSRDLFTIPATTLFGRNTTIADYPVILK